MVVEITPETTELEIDTTGGNFLEVIYFQYHQVLMKMNREMRGGFYSREIIKGTEETRLIYVPDTREEFCETLIGLCATLITKFDKKMRDQWKEHIKLEQQLEKNFMDNTSVQEDVILGEDYYESTEDKVHLEMYKQRKIKLYKNLFFKLNLFLGRKNYFEITGGIF